MAIACPVDLDTARLRHEIQAIYARVATDPSERVPLPPRSRLCRIRGRHDRTRAHGRPAHWHSMSTSGKGLQPSAGAIERLVDCDTGMAMHSSDLRLLVMRRMRRTL